MRLTKKMLEQIGAGVNMLYQDLSESIGNDFAPVTDKDTLDAQKQCEKVFDWVHHIKTKRGYHGKV